MALWNESKRSVTEDEWLFALTGVNWGQCEAPWRTYIVKVQSLVHPLTHFHFSAVQPGRNNWTKDCRQYQLRALPAELEWPPVAPTFRKPCPCPEASEPVDISPTPPPDGSPSHCCRLTASPPPGHGSKGTSAGAEPMKRHRLAWALAFEGSSAHGEMGSGNHLSSFLAPDSIHVARARANCLFFPPSLAYISLASSM